MAGFGILHTATQDRLLKIMSHLTGHKIRTVLSARTVIQGEEPAWSLFSISSGTECLLKTVPQNTGIIMSATTLFLFQPPFPLEVFVDRKEVV
jgi:hypothetical protein